MNLVSYLKHFIVFFACLCLPFAGLTQTKPIKPKAEKPGSKVIIIDHFGKLIEDKSGIESVKWISQGLQLRIDSTNIYADSAVIFGEDRVYAYGNVVIQQGDSLHIFTDTLYYFKETDVADLIGEVVLEQGSKQLWTTNLKYHLAERYGEYDQGGVMVDQDLQVSSKRGKYFAASEEIHFKDSVVVLHPNFNLAADSMKYLAQQSLVLFTGPTNIYTSTAKIFCESGFYNLETEIAEFNKHAQYGSQQRKATADTIRYLAGQEEVIMIGHVRVRDGEKNLDGNFLKYLERTGETWIYGEPARYSDSSRVVVSPEIFYNEKTNKVSTIGRAVISDGDLIIEADQSDFDQTSGMGKFSGHVEWRDTVQNIGIRSDIVDFSKETEYVLAYGTQRPLFYTLVEEDTLYISADTLHMYNAIDTLVSTDTIRMIRAYHDVRLFKSDMQGRADSLVFHGRDSLFSFYGNPVLWSDTTQFVADSIDMALKNKQVHNITLRQKAIIISEILETYFDQIKGKKIIAHFDSSAIKEMWVIGNAESVYYTRDDQSAFIGVNKTICSKMYFTFTDGQIQILKYYGDNTSSLMPMGETNHESLRLEGFQWRSDERPLHLNDLLN